MGVVSRNSIAITLLSYAGVMIGFVNKILLFTNFLTAEQVGLTSILLTVAVTYAQFSALGVNSSIVRFFPYFRTGEGRTGRGDNSHNGMFFWSALIISVGFILFTLLFLVFRRPVVEFYSAESPLLSEWYLLIVPMALATLFYNFYNSWLQALSKTVLSSGVYDVVLRLAITVVISIYTLGLIDFRQFIVTYVLVHFIPTLILLVYTASIKQSCFRPVITPRTRRMMAIFIGYGLWQLFGTASNYLTPVIDQLMLAGVKGLAQNGVYGTMIYVVSVLIMPYRSIVKVATPLVASYWKERDMKSMAQIYRSSSLTNLIIGCGLFVLIWVNLDNIFALMPGEYAAGRYVFLFLGLGRIVDMYSGLNGIILVTSKKYRYDLLFSIILVVLTITTNLLFIPRWGMYGAAMATMLSVVLHNLLMLAFVWKFYHIHPFAWSDLGVAGLALAVAAVCAVIPHIGSRIGDVAVRSLIVVALFGGVVYLGKVSPQINAVMDSFLSRFVRRK